MKICLVIFFTWLEISNALYSQEYSNPVDYRFKGGEDRYISFFSKSISLPESAIKNGVFGNSITRISINPEGVINGITTINPIDSIVDNEVIRVIDSSQNLWKKCDTVNHDQVFYIQIVFSTSQFIPNIFKPKSGELIKLFPKPILITVNGDLEHPFIKSRELSEKANLDLENGKFEEALPFINELIKRDPFNRDLYKTRIMINVRLNRPERVEEDDNKIFNFAEGYSLDDLFKDQYN